jgi:glycosyltransferase involved in cell wall biosynthesis
MVCKVVFLHTDFRLYWKRRLEKLAEFLEKKDIELTVVEISGKGSPYDFEKRGEITPDPKWIVLFPEEAMKDIDPRKAADAAIDILNKIQPDVVFAGALAFPSGAAAVRWGLFRAKPVVLFDDARLEDVPRGWLVNQVKRQLYSHVDAMVIPAPSHEQSFRYFGFSSRQLFYGLNCVDNDYFTAQSSAFNASEKPHPKPFFLAVGRQIEKKNWLKLIDAYRSASSESGDDSFDLLFIGDGPEHDQMVKASGADNGRRIHFIPFKDQEELCLYYEHAEGLVLPSLYGETWGLVVNEAMASGLPVLVSSKCGCCETLVQDGVNGYFFDPADTAAIKKALFLFMKLHIKKRMLMGNFSKAIIADWGIERFCQGVADAIDYVSSVPKRRGSLVGKIISIYWNGRYNPT